MNFCTKNQVVFGEQDDINHNKFEEKHNKPPGKTMY